MSPKQTDQSSSSARPRSPLAARQAAARPRPPARVLPIQLMRAREALLQGFRPHLHEHGLTDQQWRIIRALSEADAVEITDLGARCCIHAASLSRILPKLEAAGLTARRGDAGDHRRAIISLTAPGRRLYESLAPHADEVYAALARKLGAKRLQETCRLLDELIAAAADETNGRARGRRPAAGAGKA